MQSDVLLSKINLPEPPVSPFAAHMKLRGREKYFWKKNFNAGNIEAIPVVLDIIQGIDSDHDDEFFYYLALRVKGVDAIHLRCTNVTDQGVKYICSFKNLRQLTLKDHRNITKDCLPFINDLHQLEYLDISKNSILIKDIFQLTGLIQLKHLHISKDMLEQDSTDIPPRLFTHFRDCEVTMY